MNLSFMNGTSWNWNGCESSSFPPATFPVKSVQPTSVTYATPHSNWFDPFEFSDKFEIHLARISARASFSRACQPNGLRLSGPGFQRPAPTVCYAAWLPCRFIRIAILSADRSDTKTLPYSESIPNREVHQPHSEGSPQAPRVGTLPRFPTSLRALMTH